MCQTAVSVRFRILIRLRIRIHIDTEIKSRIRMTPDPLHASEPYVSKLFSTVNNPFVLKTAEAVTDKLS